MKETTSTKPRQEPKYQTTWSRKTRDATHNIKFSPLGKGHGDMTDKLTLSGPDFSVARQVGGSEAQMPKIKVNINRLK